MPTLDDQRRAAGLSPLPVIAEEVEDDAPKCQHGCPTVPCLHTKTEEKHKQHPASAMRGVPILGKGVGGAVNGSRPGDGLRAIMAEIDEAYEQARQSKINRHRFKRPKDVE